MMQKYKLNFYTPNTWRHLFSVPSVSMRVDNFLIHTLGRYLMFSKDRVLK